MMNKLSMVLLIAAGLLNFVPVIGVISTDQLSSMYGVEITSADMSVLMRHRAVMLGLVGGLMIVAAFRPTLRLPAAIVGLISMASFIVLAGLATEIGPNVSNVAIADIAGVVIILGVLAIELRGRRDG